MKAFLRTALPALEVLLLIQLASAQAPHLTPFSADMQVSSTHGDGGARDMEGKIYVASGHMRMNVETGGHETAIITDFATRTTDILMPQQHMYMEHKAGQTPGRGPGNFAQDLKPYDPENPCANQPDVTCKKIGVEEVNGRACDHWELTDKRGKVANIWIDQKLYFPIKAVSQNSTLLLSNIQEGEPDASLFQIPPDFRKFDMGGMMPPGMSGPPQQ